MVDLNTAVTNLPDRVTLEVAQAINGDGAIVGTTCSGFCEAGRQRRAGPSCCFPTHRGLLARWAPFAASDDRGLTAVTPVVLTA